jgi:DNA invertase Pin-like site-specific DNA recombinase
MKIGYARVSTGTKPGALQLAPLKRAKCQKISRTKDCQEARRSTLPYGVASRNSNADTLTVWKLDRLACSVNHLIGIMGEDVS